MMKFIYITCNISGLEQIEELLRRMKIKNYQIIPKVLAESEFDIPRKDTAIWPSYNASVLVQESDEEKASALIDAISKLNEQAFNNSELVSAHMWSIERSAVVNVIQKIESRNPLKEE
ncbi:PG0541 family transporter-associated protein [Porphyromonas miyakawae]